MNNPQSRNIPSMRKLSLHPTLKLIYMSLCMCVYHKTIRKQMLQEIRHTQKSKRK